MIKRKGLIPAIDEIVQRKTEAPGYKVLMEMGLSDKTFEAVVLRHPDAFSSEAVAASQRRLQSSNFVVRSG